MNTLKKLLEAYTVTIQPLVPEDGPGFIARYKELGPAVRGIGSTEAEALAELKEMALEGWDDVDLAEMPRPESEAPWAGASGRITLRLPKMLHARVARQADAQGVSTNQWICHVLESAATAVDSGCEFGASAPKQDSVLRPGLTLVYGSEAATTLVGSTTEESSRTALFKLEKHTAFSQLTEVCSA
jgi:antitoxin HicB